MLKSVKHEKKKLMNFIWKMIAHYQIYGMDETT